MALPHILILGTDQEILDTTTLAHERLRSYADNRYVVSIFVRTSTADASLPIRSDAFSVFPVPTRTKVGFFFAAIRRALRLHYLRPIRLVVAQDPVRVGLVSAAIARLVGARLLLSAFGVNVFNPFWVAESFSNRIFSYIGRVVIALADGAQGDSPELCDTLRARYPKLRVFHKLLIPADIGRLRDVAHEQDDVFRVLFAARFVPQKNIPLLLETVALLDDRYGSRVRTTVVGDGPEASGFLAGIKERNLHSVTYLAHASRSELCDLLAQTDAFLLTSNYEGFARILMEAAACGVPVVTTDVSGARDIVGDNQGGYVVERTPEALVGALGRLIEDPALTASMRAWTKEHFWSTYGAYDVSGLQRRIFIELLA